MDRIPKDLLERTATGVNLMPGSLGDQIGDRPTLLVFLRHFGCIFCREAVSDLRAIAESREDYPAVLFFAQAGSTESRAFMRRYWPSARVVVDPDLELYDRFGIDRARLLQAFGPSVLRASRRAKEKGHENGPRNGDVFRMPGAMLVRGGDVLWRYQPRHAADHPEFAEVPAIAAAALARV